MFSTENLGCTDQLFGSNNTVQNLHTQDNDNRCLLQFLKNEEVTFWTSNPLFFLDDSFTIYT